MMSEQPDSDNVKRDESDEEMLSGDIVNHEWVGVG